MELARTIRGRLYLRLIILGASEQDAVGGKLRSFAPCREAQARGTSSLTRPVAGMDSPHSRAASLRLVREPMDGERRMAAQRQMGSGQAQEMECLHQRRTLPSRCV